VHGGSSVAQSVLSPGVEIERGAEIEQSILMPGVSVGKNARLRRVIVEEGVEIPAGFCAGFDLDHDRLHHTVTDSGVVVVGKITQETRPAAVWTTKRRPQIRVATAAA
jgi:glucose-1-phosphate adenylyltransferase